MDRFNLSPSVQSKTPAADNVPAESDPNDDAPKLQMRCVSRGCSFGHPRMDVEMVEFTLPTHLKGHFGDEFQLPVLDVEFELTLPLPRGDRFGDESPLLEQDIVSIDASEPTSAPAPPRSERESFTKSDESLDNQPSTFFYPADTDYLQNYPTTTNDHSNVVAHTDKYDRSKVVAYTDKYDLTLVDASETGMNATDGACEINLFGSDDDGDDANRPSFVEACCNTGSDSESSDTDADIPSDVQKQSVPVGSKWGISHSPLVRTIDALWKISRLYHRVRNWSVCDIYELARYHHREMPAEFRVGMAPSLLSHVLCCNACTYRRRTGMTMTDAPSPAEEVFLIKFCIAQLAGTLGKSDTEQAIIWHRYLMPVVFFELAFDWEFDHRQDGQYDPDTYIRQSIEWRYHLRLHPSYGQSSRSSDDGAQVVGTKARDPTLVKLITMGAKDTISGKYGPLWDLFYGHCQERDAHYFWYRCVSALLSAQPDAPTTTTTAAALEAHVSQKTAEDALFTRIVQALFEIRQTYAKVRQWDLCDLYILACYHESGMPVSFCNGIVAPLEEHGKVCGSCANLVHDGFYYENSRGVTLIKQCIDIVREGFEQISWRGYHLDALLKWHEYIMPAFFFVGPFEEKSDHRCRWTFCDYDLDPFLCVALISEASTRDIEQAPDAPYGDILMDTDARKRRDYIPIDDDDDDADQDEYGSKEAKLGYLGVCALQQRFDSAGRWLRKGEFAQRKFAYRNVSLLAVEGASEMRARLGTRFWQKYASHQILVMYWFYVPSDDALDPYKVLPSDWSPTLRTLAASTSGMYDMALSSAAAQRTFIFACGCCSWVHVAQSFRDAITAMVHILVEMTDRFIPIPPV